MNISFLNKTFLLNQIMSMDLFVFLKKDQKIFQMNCEWGELFEIN